MSGGNAYVFGALHAKEVTVIVRGHDGWTQQLQLDDFLGDGILVSGHDVDGLPARRFEVVVSGRLARIDHISPVDAIEDAPPQYSGTDRLVHVRGRMHAVLAGHTFPTGPQTIELLDKLVDEAQQLAEEGFLHPRRGDWHVVKLWDDGHTIRHPVSCRRVADCPVARAKLPKKPRLPAGEYRCDLSEDGDELVYGTRL